MSQASRPHGPNATSAGMKGRFGLRRLVHHRRDSFDGTVYTASAMTDLSAAVVTLCWGVLALVWVFAARARDRHAARPPRLRSGAWSVPLGVTLACAVVLAIGTEAAAGMTVGVSWAAVLGLGVLVPATAFTIWARISLGTMWSVEARVGADRRLCTTGPYAVTRHPIYSGVLGMLLGTTLLVGDGQLIMLVPLALLLLEAKIRVEERLLLATFPQEYASYRHHVPQLVPGLRGWRRHEPEMQGPGPTSR
jgi:protein-S-isoprenylcysteine O-methyltransferase Ste14